jgi:hypothetical protein
MAKSEKYRAIVGGNYARPGRPRTGPGSTDEIRFEAGAILENLPTNVAEAYLGMKAIEKYEGADAASKTAVVTASPDANGGVVLTPVPEA